MLELLSESDTSGTLHSIYRGIVQSHFDYCNAVWDSCSKTLSDKLQRLQNRAAWNIAYSNYDADANKLMKILGWKNLETQRQIHKVQMVYKSLNGLAPNYLSSKFIQRSDIITSYNLRDFENKLAVPLPRTNYCKNSFSYSSAILCPLLLGKQNLWLSFDRC